MKQATQFLRNDNIPAINAAVAEVLRKFKTGETKSETPEAWLVELADVQRAFEMDDQDLVLLASSVWHMWNKVPEATAFTCAFTGDDELGFVASKKMSEKDMANNFFADAISTYKESRKTLGWHHSNVLKALMRELEEKAPNEFFQNLVKLFGDVMTQHPDAERIEITELNEHGKGTVKLVLPIAGPLDSSYPDITNIEAHEVDAITRALTDNAPDWSDEYKEVEKKYGENQVGKLTSVILRYVDSIVPPGKQVKTVRCEAAIDGKFNLGIELAN